MDIFLRLSHPEGLLYVRNDDLLHYFYGEEECSHKNGILFHDECRRFEVVRAPVDPVD